VFAVVQLWRVVESVKTLVLACGLPVCEARVRLVVPAKGSY
jgi:hypothetical protein